MLHFVQRGRRRLRQTAEQICQPPRLYGSAAIEATHCLIKLRDELFHRGPGVGVRRSGIDLFGVEGILKKEVRVLDEGELLLLIFRDETLQRQHLVHFRQPAQPFG